MKRFLLFLGSFGVGSSTVLMVFTFTAATDPTVGPQAAAGAILMFVIMLIFGIVLSAPYALSPPEDGRSWWISLPVYLALALLLVRAVAFVGYLELLLVWKLVFLFWRRRPATPTYPTAPYVPVQHVPYLPRMQGQAPPSWQRDPTGRFGQRYWDGRAWTSHVANGTNTGIDPL